MRLVLTLASCLLLVGCPNSGPSSGPTGASPSPPPPPRVATASDLQALVTSWKAASENDDAKAAWGLLAKATRERITSGFAKSLAKAPRDVEFGKLLAAASAPADT